MQAKFYISLFKICLLGLIILFRTTSDIQAQITYYVSPSGNDNWSGKVETPVAADGPFASISAAVEKVKTDFRESGGEDYRIILRGGTHPVSRQIVISEEEQFRISFEAYPGENPILSAGRKITGWKKSRVNGVACWKVNLPEVESGDYYFRQLFVNGQRASRPRFPESGFYEVEDILLGEGENFGQQYANAARDHFIFKEGDINKWKNFTDINAMVLHYWQEDYLPFKEVDFKKREIKFTAKSFMPFYRSHPAHSCGNAWYYVDNVFEALDKPGEWYLDRPTGNLYYIPKSGEKIDKTEVFAPVLTQIIRINGNADQNKFAGNVHFRGLSFRHSEIVWDAHYGTPNGYGNSGPALISLNRAKDCSISECEFINLGEYAIEISGGSERIYVTGNSFSDLGAGAIKINSGSNIHITDNEIHSGGRVFHSAVAVLSGGIKYSRILHNHISDFYYNGIVCGGGRRSMHEGAPGSYDNLIMKNHIHDLGQGWLSDMGGIYVPGLQPGMIISGNIIHDITSACYGGNAVYLDDACQHVIVEQNMLYNTNNVIVNFKGTENVVRNNILAFGEQSIIRRASTLREENSVASVYKNIMLVNDSYVHRTRHEIPVFQPGYWSDLNIIWNIGKESLKVEQPLNYGEKSVVGSFDEWIEKTQNDIHSVFRDPEFRDPLKGDFTLDPNSFIYKLGINPGSFDDVGPRPKEKWELTKVQTVTKEVSTEGHIE
jgi:hypothetical protein